MAYNDNPKVRDCEDLAGKYGYDKVILIGINEKEREFSVTSYGENRNECTRARDIGTRVYEAVYNFFLHE